MDLRRSKRYRLRAFVKFAWEDLQGTTIRGEGQTRDISAAGLFVLTGDRLPLETPLKLEVTLPSLREDNSGACLRTHGQVVHSEDIGFGAVANMGFQIQLPELQRARYSVGKSRGNGEAKQEAGGEADARSKRLDLISRLWSK
jgi:hypothetical protein